MPNPCLNVTSSSLCTDPLNHWGSINTRKGVGYSHERFFHKHASLDCPSMCGHSYRGSRRKKRKVSPLTEKPKMGTSYFTKISKLGISVDMGIISCILVPWLMTLGRLSSSAVTYRQI